MIFRFFTLLLFSFLLSFSSQALAQGHGLYCDQADSTAATQKCLKKHLDTAQKRLNKIYTLLNGAMDAEKKSELDELQKTWLSYRDSECMWEAQNADNASLKRINELSCMARVTDDRADILTIVHEDKIQLDTVREYGSFPRWMNVAAKENPKVYWDYAKRQGFDLDCDGEEEYIMSGMMSDVVEVQSEGEEISKTSYNNNVVVSVSQNPSVGKPTTSVFKFPVQAIESQDTICDQNFTYKFNAGDVLSEEVTQCQAILEIQAGKCTPKKIQWDGKDFALVVPEVVETEKDENKK